MSPGLTAWLGSDTGVLHSCLVWHNRMEMPRSTCVPRTVVTVACWRGELAHLLTIPYRSRNSAWQLSCIVRITDSGHCLNERRVPTVLYTNNITYSPPPKVTLVKRCIWAEEVITMLLL